MSIALIGLGSNLGDRARNLERAIELLEKDPQIDVSSTSSWHATRPVGGPSGQDDFLNGAITLDTSHVPHSLLRRLQEIENQLGRHRGLRWGPRTIDLDFLLYDEMVLDSPELRLPHPHMAIRRFVLAPAVEVASAMIHPVTGWSVERLWQHLQQHSSYVALAGPIGVGKSELSGALIEQNGGRLVAERVDEKALERFYADPSGRAWETEIEFLRQRADQLNASDWPREPELTISDYWFDQSVAFANLWLSTEWQAEFQEKWLQHRARVVLPKLLILLDAPASELVARIARRGRSCEMSLNETWLDLLRHQLELRALHPDTGPHLRVDATDLPAALSEIASSIEAMR